MPICGEAKGGIREGDMTRVLEGEILPGETETSARQEKVRTRFWDTLRKAAAKFPMLEEPVAAYYCALDPRTPVRTRAILLAALAYFVVPADLVPDLLAGIGFTDDLTVIAAAIAAVRGSILPSHREAARAAVQRFGA
jgi:uncharacterized membrane protein YkvA (DUF1232 family)